MSFTDRLSKLFQKKGTLVTAIKWSTGFVTGWIMFMVLSRYHPAPLAFIESAAFAIGEIFFMQEYRTTGSDKRRKKMKTALFLFSSIAFIAALQEHSSRVTYADYDFEFWTWAVQIFLTIVYSFARTAVLWYLSDLDFKKEDEKNMAPKVIAVTVEDERTPTRIALENEIVKKALLSIVTGMPRKSKNQIATDEDYLAYLIDQEIRRSEGVEV